MPYMYPDLNVARALVDAGAACDATGSTDRFQ